MALTQVAHATPPPWGAPKFGTLDLYEVESSLLATNALGDPARRPLYVYTAHGAQDAPAIYLLQGYGNRVGSWLADGGFDPTKLMRFDAMFGAGDCPPAVIVFLDAWTKLGGSQFVNSTAIGRYSDHICDEIVPFIDARHPVRAHASGRGVCGHSSGGYGALVNAMTRPDVFGAIAAQAPDSLFESVCLRDIPEAVRALRDRFGGSLERFLEALDTDDPFRWGSLGALATMYMCACAYSPDPDAPTRPQFPFELSTGRLIPEVWERWLAADPVRMVPRHVEALSGLRHIRLEAGNHDDMYLDLGTQAVAAALERAGIPHTFELFDGGHSGISHRFPAAVRALIDALV